MAHMVAKIIVCCMMQKINHRLDFFITLLLVLQLSIHTPYTFDDAAGICRNQSSFHVGGKPMGNLESPKDLNVHALRLTRIQTLGPLVVVFQISELVIFVDL